MCRLMFADAPKDVNLLEEQMTRLEASQGGQGSGIALLKPGGSEILKGVKMRPRELAEKAVEFGGPVLFHTRMASIGPVCDTLCQPFASGHLTVAHNGHWNEWNDGLTSMLRANKLKFVPLLYSDSLIATLMARYWGVGILGEYIGTGVWISATSGTKDGPLQVLATVNSGQFCFNKTKNEAMSEPVYWSHDDDVQWVMAGSIVQLYPTMELVSGHTMDSDEMRKRIAEINKKKGGKK